MQIYNLDYPGLKKRFLENENITQTSEFTRNMYFYQHLKVQEIMFKFLDIKHYVD